MEVRYKKDMNHNYLILGYEREVGYEINMVINNKLNGLLKGNLHTFNGCTELYYDISSKQPLNRIYLKRELSFADVKGILRSLQLLLEELRRYLLNADCVVFDAEYCYCNPNNRKPEWIYYPEDKKGHGIRNLAEFLIERVNHAEHKAVDMAYRFYKMVKDDILTAKDLLELLEEYEEDEKVTTNVIENNIYEDDYVFETEEKEILQGRVPIPEHKIKQNQNTWLNIKNTIRKIFNWGFEEKNGGPGRKNVKLETEAYRKREEKRKKGVEFDRKESSLNCKEWMKRETPIEWETYGLEREDMYTGETRVMGVQNSTSTRRLRNLSKVGGSDISLQKLPCILGKMEDCSDIVLRDPSISRMHARIFEEDGELYLQDLNSTNGSYINNLELEGNETVKLKMGDEVIFGNLRYIYE